MGDDTQAAENKRKRQDSVKATAPVDEPELPAEDTAIDSAEQPTEALAKDGYPEAASPPKRPRTSDVSDEENDNDSDAKADAAVPAVPQPELAPAPAEAKPVGIAAAPVFGMSFASARALGGFAAAAKALAPLQSLASVCGGGFAKYASAPSPKAEPAAAEAASDTAADAAEEAADAADAEEPSTGKSERTFEDMLTAEGKESLADNVAMSTVVPAMAHTHMAELQAEPVRTHEEDETCLFSTKAKLFELDDDNWKERGGGHLKVNRHNDSSRRCRLVMRTDQTFRLILNVPLFPAMKLSHERRFVRFTCLNTDTMAPATFVLRFASDAMATDAHRAISDAIPPPDAAPKDKGKGADTAPASGSEDDDEDYANDDDDESSSSDEEEEEEEDKEEDDADEEDNEAAEVANHDDDGASDNVEASDDDEAASSSDKESA